MPLAVAEKIPGEFATVKTDISSFGHWLTDSSHYTLSHFKAFLSDVDWAKTAISAASLVAGTHSDSALVHLNTGASIAMNTNESNLLDLNFGLSASALSHTVSSQSIVNWGMVAGTETTLLAKEIFNTGNIQGLEHFTLKAQHLVNEGTIYGNHACVTIDTLQQEGLFDLFSGAAYINHFNNATQGESRFSEMMLSGEQFSSSGYLDASDSYFSYAEEFNNQRGSQMRTENVSIKTGKFYSDGTTDYLGFLEIRANKAVLDDHSLVRGAKTDSDQLFIPIPTPAPTETPNESAPSQETPPASTEPQTEFRPQHVLSLLAEEIELNGQLRGGDYTQIAGLAIGDNQEAVAARSLSVGSQADIDLNYGSIRVDHTDFHQGNTNLQNFSIDSVTTTIDADAHVQLTHSSLTGNSLHSSGELQTDTVLIQMTEDIFFTAGAHEQMRDTSLSAHEVSDASTLDYQRQVAINADQYTHRGTVNALAKQDEIDNLFYVAAKEAVLNGTGNFDNAYYAIDHFQDGANFITGQGSYSQYKMNNYFGFETQDNIDLSTSFSRDCDLTITAASIKMTADYNQAHHLALISKQGGIILDNSINARSLSVTSATDIFNNRSLYADEGIYFDAQGTYYNLGGIVNGDTVAIKAQNIYNLSAGSALAQGSWGISMGSAGLINGRSKTFLEATTGNIENHGGAIRGGDYTQLIAKGTVINQCNVRRYNGAYDIIETYDPV